MKKYKYRYVVLDIYSGNLLYLNSNVLYKIGDIVDDSYEVREFAYGY